MSAERTVTIAFAGLGLLLACTAGEAPRTAKEGAPGSTLTSAVPGEPLAESVATAEELHMPACAVPPESGNQSSFERVSVFYRCIDQSPNTGADDASQRLMTAIEKWHVDQGPGVPYADNWTHLLSLKSFSLKPGAHLFIPANRTKVQDDFGPDVFLTGLPARDRTGRDTGDIVLAIVSLQGGDYVALAILDAKGPLGSLGDAQDGKYFGVFYPVYERRGDLVRLTHAPVQEVWIDLRDLPMDHTLEDAQAVLTTSDEIQSFSEDPLVVVSAPEDDAERVLVNSESGRRAVLLARGISVAGNPHFEIKPTGNANGDWIEVDATYFAEGDGYCGNDVIGAVIRGWVRWRDPDGRRQIDYTRYVTC